MLNTNTDKNGLAKLTLINIDNTYKKLAEVSLKTNNLALAKKYY